MTAWARSALAIPARRRLAARARNAVALLGVLVLVLAGCGTSNGPKAWHSGRLTIGGGNSTGVFYQVGGGYADVISKYLPGYRATLAPTAGSADNLLRLSRDDVQIALTFADVAGDAVRGEGLFAQVKPPMRALAQVYSSYTHLVVRADAGINQISDLRHKRVSTASKNSGSEALALRTLVAAGLDPDKDVVRSSLSLPEATRAILEGSIDALFWSGGLPTAGITDLLEKGRSMVKFLPVDSVLPALNEQYPDTYVPATIPAATYGLGEDLQSFAVVNLLVVAESVPDDLAYQLTKVIFDHQDELVQVHPEWKNVDRITAAQTEPVPLHPGAARFYENK